MIGATYVFKIERSIIITGRQVLNHLLNTWYYSWSINNEMEKNGATLRIYDNSDLNEIFWIASIRMETWPLNRFIYLFISYFNRKLFLGKDTFAHIFSELSRSKIISKTNKKLSNSLIRLNLDYYTEDTLCKFDLNSSITTVENE